MARKPTTTVGGTTKPAKGTQYIAANRGTTTATTAKLNQQRSEAVIDILVNVARNDTPRVVYQSIAAGTLVAPGTAVDIVAVPPDDTPITIFDEYHKYFESMMIGQLRQYIEDPKIRELLETYEDAESMPAAKREEFVVAVRNKAPELSISDNPTNQNSFELLFATMQDAAIFA